jgi:hypothetical protein
MQSIPQVSPAVEQLLHEELLQQRRQLALSLLRTLTSLSHNLADNLLNEDKTQWHPELSPMLHRAITYVRHLEETEGRLALPLAPIE